LVIKCDEIAADDEEIRTAVGLDPLSTALQTYLASQLYFARRYEESIAQARRVLELVPNSRFAHQVLGSDFEQLQRFDIAMQEWNQDLSLGGEHELAAALTRLISVMGMLVRCRSG